MKKSILVMITALLLALALVLPVCAAEADTEQWNAQELGASLDAFLESKADNHAAVAVLVFTAEDDLYTRYFGAVDAAGNVPLNEDHVLEWGSTTKLLVWISAMQLWEAGKLDLNEDIRTYLPDGFLKNLRFDKPVTMLNLMNHNAGFQETTFVLEVEDEEDIIPLGEYLATYQPLQAHVTMDPCLARLGILPLVDNAWSSDDFGMIKAKPEIYRAVAKRLGVSVEDCIFFDDNLGAITAARAAGMHTVGVYDESGKHAEEQMKQTAERYIYRFSKI